MTVGRDPHPRASSGERGSSRPDGWIGPRSAFTPASPAGGRWTRSRGRSRWSPPAWSAHSAGTWTPRPRTTCGTSGWTRRGGSPGHRAPRRRHRARDRVHRPEPPDARVPPFAGRDAGRVPEAISPRLTPPSPAPLRRPRGSVRPGAAGCSPPCGATRRASPPARARPVHRPPAAPLGLHQTGLLEDAQVVRDQRVGQSHQQLEVGQAEPALARADRPGPWALPPEQQLEHSQPGRLGHRLQRAQQFVRTHVAAPANRRTRDPAATIARRVARSHFSPGNGLVKKQIPCVGIAGRGKSVTQSSFTQAIA